jgi:amino acid adenylation domain-containing protein
MTIIQFLDHLRNLNIRVGLNGDDLHIRAASAALTADIRAELAARKPEIMRFLRQLPAGRANNAVPRAARIGRIPLTFAQQRLWFLDRLNPGDVAYNICDVNDIPRAINLQALRLAFNEVVRRHEILRTSFPAVEGVPMQSIAPPSEMPLPIVDLSGLPEDARWPEVCRMAFEERRAPFDLVRGPLFRASLVKLSAQKYVAFVSLHHIICDDWSKKLLGDELETLYAAYSAGRSSPLAELPIQWADFAVWQHEWLSGMVLDSHVRYWTQQLSGELPTLELPQDHPRRNPPAGAHGSFCFAHSLTSALAKLCESERVTLFMSMLAGYAALLACYTGQEDVIVGSPVSDRSSVETESLIGFFLNTLPLRIRVDGAKTFQELLQQVKDVCLGAYAYQTVPYGALLQRLDIERDGSGTPIFRTMLVLLNTPPIGSSARHLGSETQEQFPGCDEDAGVLRSDDGNGATKFDLSLTFVGNEKEIRGRVEYNCDIFEASTVAKLIERLQRLLRSAAGDPRQKICEIQLMAQHEREQLLLNWCPGSELSSNVSCLHEFVERRARLAPLAIALEADTKSLSYAEVNERANRLARWLLAHGVAPEGKVGVFFERSWQQMVAVLGVLKAGAGYVPLDPAHPIKRLESVIEDAGLNVVVTMHAMEATFNSLSLRMVCLDRDAADIAALDSGDLPQVTSSENLACVLYTSGSTGRPKGVLLTHGAVINFLSGATRDYGVDTTDRVLQFASIGFDLSLAEMFLPFSTGATLVLRPKRMLDSNARFMAQCEELRLTVLVLPTAYWHELVATLHELTFPSCVRCVIIAGERALPQRWARWQELIGERTALFNAYGPTEGTIAVTRYKCPGQVIEHIAGMEVPIGRPVANCAVYIVDRWMELLPPGVPGELYLGGKAVARGYLGQPGLTAERFVADPFSRTPGGRLYRTGDLARFLPDGTLEYRGRADNQVKIRGYRVEPREIEAALRSHAAVRDVRVIAREDDPGDRRLVAYIVLEEGGIASPADLRAFLTPMLPSYMVPAAFMLLRVLPLNVNGKVNHRALPSPQIDRADTVSNEEEQLTPTQKKVASIWAAVLKLEHVGIHEDFFELGGHSLLATQIVARVNDALQIDLPLRRLFDAPTIADLCVIVEQLVREGAEHEHQLSVAANTTE